MTPSDQLLTNWSKKRGFWPVLKRTRKKAQVRKPMPSKEFWLTAGDGIRTHDVQLGKLAFYH